MKNLFIALFGIIVLSSQPLINKTLSPAQQTQIQHMAIAYQICVDGHEFLVVISPSSHGKALTTNEINRGNFKTNPCGEDKSR